MTDFAGASGRRAAWRAALVALLLGFAAGTASASSGGTGLGGAPRAHRHHRTHHHARHAGNPLDGRAMWIWEMPSSNGGSVPAIIARARRNGVTTLLIKSSDGGDGWSQFSPALVAALHAAHLRVCAWQYVYGTHPGDEANLGADAVKDGADCLVIDAESEYEGRYVAAQRYVSDLRKQIGGAYPVALAGFPYVDYHPGFPYSVFLGPNGAQYNVPQMYWRDIGTSVDRVYAHTYAYNRPYGRPIFPLGQIYSRPPVRQIVRFRTLGKAYGARGLSWWDWQEAGGREWRAVSRPAGAAHHPAVYRLMGPVGRGAVGDLVVWVQEHLVSAGDRSAIDGDYGRSTRAAVRAFQRAHGLAADGIVGPATWKALLRYRPVHVRWVHHGRRIVAADLVRAHDARTAATGSSAGTSAPITLAVPRSASRHARRDEIPAGLGRGRP